MIQKMEKDLGVSAKEIKDVESAMWKYVKSTIQEGNSETEIYKSIYLRYLGTIHVAPGRIRMIKKAIEKKRNEDTRSI